MRGDSQSFSGHRRHLWVPGLPDIRELRCTLRAVID